jgi:hypothetical protein
MRISHTELGAAQQDFAGWWRTKQGARSGGPRFGYAQAIKLAVYKFHRLGDRAASLAHFDQLVATRLTNAKRIANARLQLESYIEWTVRSSVIVADHRIRLNLPLEADIVLGGEISRIDITRRGYRAVLLGHRFLARWKQESRMPLIQLAVADRYQRSADEVRVAVQLLDGSALDETSFNSADRNEALTAATSLATRIVRMQARSASRR